MADNVIYRLSKAFALRIVKEYDHLTKCKGEYVMSKQLYRSGTSVGANIAESLYAQSDADYVSKLKISLKELIGENDELLSEPIFLKRPEQLSVDEFISLTNLIENNN